MDGISIIDAGRELAQHGIGGFRIGDPGDELEDLIPIIERTAIKKSVKDYSDSTVVFNVGACPSFKGFESQHEEQLERIRGALSALRFCAKRVYVMVPSGRVERIDGKFERLAGDLSQTPLKARLQHFRWSDISYRLVLAVT